MIGRVTRSFVGRGGMAAEKRERLAGRIRDCEVGFEDQMEVAMQQQSCHFSDLSTHFIHTLLLDR